MLIEIRDVRQIPGEGLRRWFTDSYFDLIVWYEGEEVAGFQLCYDKTHSERALTWLASGSVTHTRVDDGECPGGPKMTPVLVQDGAFDARAIALLFRSSSLRIEPAISSLVLRILTRLQAG